MGRPLYSIQINSRASSNGSSTAASRSSSPPAEPALLICEKWSPWNAFDPDADSFFESENAVYEAFLDTPEYLERTRENQPPLLSLVEALGMPLADVSATPETSAEDTSTTVPIADDVGPWAIAAARLEGHNRQGSNSGVPFIPPMPIPSLTGQDDEFNRPAAEPSRPSGLPSPDLSENRYTTLYSNFSREDVTPSSYSRVIIPTHNLFFQDHIVSTRDRLVV